MIAAGFGNVSVGEKFLVPNQLALTPLLELVLFRASSYDIRRLFAICAGTIPEELGKLTALVELNLASNNLSGEKTQTVVLDSRRWVAPTRG